MQSQILSRLMACAFLMLSVFGVDAADFNKKGLSATEKQKIQAIGQRVLASRRHASIDPEAMEMKAEIEQIRAQLIELTNQSAYSTTRLRPYMQFSGVQPTTSSGDENDWHQAHAPKIAQLNTLLDQVKGRSVAMEEKQINRFSAMSKSHHSPVKGAMGSVSRATLTKLKRLKADVSDALSMPARERDERLSKLAESLQITAMPWGYGLKSTGVEETPTLRIRTTHR